MKAEKIYNDYINGDSTDAGANFDADNAAYYIHKYNGVETYYFGGDDNAIRIAKSDGDIDLIDVKSQKWAVSDSRSLDSEVNLNLFEAIEWLNDKCESHGMDKDDWMHSDYWQGCETPPTLHTMEEWEELNNEN